MLSEPTFHNCWFELADLNVESVLTDEYASWIRSSADAITEWRGEGDERWLGWRFDQSLLDSLSGHVKLRPNRNQTGERLSRWLSEGRSTAAFHKMLQSETYAADLLTGRIDPAAAQRDFERQRAFHAAAGQRRPHRRLLAASRLVPPATHAHAHAQLSELFSQIYAGAGRDVRPRTGPHVPGLRRPGS